MAMVRKTFNNIHYCPDKTNANKARLLASARIKVTIFVVPAEGR